MSQITFKHTPMVRPAEQIRLLKLDTETDIIRLSMQTCDLTESPAFVALSYEWGDESEMYDIVIDGAVFQIRKNLRDALEHIRILQTDRSSTRLSEDDSPYLWIDAIAIDQAIHQERTGQVNIMGKIYRQACQVIAWLGLEQPGDFSALALKYLASDPQLPYVYQRRSLLSVSAEEMAIKRLCERSYFRRIWIVQECVLARKLHLVCGLHYCSWEHLHNFNTSLHWERISEPVDYLFNAKSLFESNWDGKSIQDTMSRILGIAIGRHCLKFHDRIYGLLGILQQSYQRTGMEVDYEASPEELMIKAQAFLTSDLEDDDPSDYPFWILRVFEPVTSMGQQGKVAWYWQINEIMYKLDADVIKGFNSLETLRSQKERALTFQTVCWIVGGYGVDLFSSSRNATSQDTSTTIQTVSLESERNYESHSNNRVFVMHSRYMTGSLRYSICLTHRPREPYSLPDKYMMTEPDSWDCRTLLETYSKHVQWLGMLRETVKVPTELSDLEKPTSLPIQVEWMVFSNLLAQYFLSKYYIITWSNRKTRTDGFVRQIEREGKDLGTYLHESLFDKYRMSVTNKSDELPANALKSVEIEITNSNHAEHHSGLVKKILVASLYDNDA